MSRYTDADALKMDLYSIIKADYGYTTDVLAGLMIAKNVIDNAPTVDAVVVHACWIGYETMSWRHGIPKRRKYYRCSNCKTASAVRHKACPNCRAIMDADTQEREGGK